MKMYVLGLVMMFCAACEAQDAWTAKWIGAPWSTVRDGAEADGSRPMPMFRRDMEIRGKVARAELRIAGLGQFSARMDGELVGPAGLHEAWTNYKKTVEFQTCDVTAQMQPGKHALAVMLGNGMYNVQRSVMANGKARYTKFEGSFGAPKMIAELRLTYADGHNETIMSDEQWKVARSPVVLDSTYGGEDSDARMADAKEAGWSAAVQVESPGGTLIPAIAPEVLEAENYKPLKTTDAGQGRIVYDLGQNFAGVPRIKVQGPAGAVLKLTPGELLKPDGTVDQGSSGGPMWWTYTLNGSAKGEEWRPLFGFYGFRYVQAEWAGGSGKIVDLTGVGLHSASRMAGAFASSNATLDAIHKLIVEAMHNNEVSIFTDCPHREKLGWLDETVLVADAVMYNNDLRGLYAATARNIADAQHEDGDVPTIAPQYTVFGGKNAVYDDSPEWGSASVLATWAAYRFYGDKTQLEVNYPVMQRYVAFLEGKAVDGIVAYGLGDWYDIGPGNPGFSKLTTLGVTGTLMLYEDAVTLQKIATLLGRRDDATKYEALAEKTRAAFNARFYDAAQGFYDKGSQTAQAMPLALGIVPEAARAKVMAKLVGDIHAHDDHVTTGEVGYPYLMRALMDTGQDNLLLAMMLRRDSPSYASQLAAGATALTEAWDANPKSSQDHFMLGAGDEWFYRGLGGIDVDMSRRPEEQITIRPRIVDGVDWAKVGYDSVRGKIESDWTHRNGETTYEVTVPSGVRATIVLPGTTQVVSGSLRVTVKDAAK